MKVSHMDFVGCRAASCDYTVNDRFIERSYAMLLRDVMTRSVEEITPQASLAEAAQKMRSLDVGALPVCEGDKLVGILTDRDITIRAVAEGRDPNRTKVADAMTPEV